MRHTKPAVLTLATVLVALFEISAESSAEDRRSGDFTWKPVVEYNAYYYALDGTWWGLAPADFDTDRSYAEFWLHPSVEVSQKLESGGELYGGVSVGISQDIDCNAFDYCDEGEIDWENAFVGYRSGSEEGWQIDLSAGSQPFSLGTGMLIHAGAINGNEWGSAASFMRSAWRRTAIAKVSRGDVSAQAFWLDPNEVPSIDSKTELAGASIEWHDDTDGDAGVAYFNVIDSEYFYPGSLAPFAFIEDGRDGLDVYHGWTEFKGLFGTLPNFAFRAEGAYQRGEITRLDGQIDRMRADSWYLGASYWFQSAPFAPKLTYGQAYFSGDDPATSTYERFDSLFWGNGLDNWWFGANGAYAWLNSNTKFTRVTLDGYLSEKDIFKLQFVRADAAELNSPLQFGQAVRFGQDSPVLVVGVDSSHLTDELMLQYVHVFKPTLVLSAYVAHSKPGDGLKDLSPETSQDWTTFGIGLTGSF